jgi:hypothetical protein
MKLAGSPGTTSITSEDHHARHHEAERQRQGFGVRNDGQIEILGLEHIIEPLRPFDIGDVDIDADLAQLRGDDLAATAGIARRRQLQRQVRSLTPASASSALDSSGS